ncbi:MAG: class I SAM-dependent methyltransferase [Desulfobacterales bacterium]|nr:class I SAM-dependent methyltransferase [Desulfobacterales bacterium]
MNFERLYEYRFKGINQGTRQVAWNEIALFVYDQLGRPSCVLDPASGRGEFISAIPAKERWAVDETTYHSGNHQGAVRFIQANIFNAELKNEYFDGVFVSNFLEHLQSQEQVSVFLEKMYRVLRQGGRIAVMGPNFKYCSSEYFDCADHTLALTGTAVAEHLYAAGFNIRRVIHRFIPFSFRSIIPPNPLLIRWYLRMPFAWRFLGKQFLLIAER